MKRILIVAVALALAGTVNALADEQPVRNGNGNLSQEGLAQIGLGSLKVMSDREGTQVRPNVSQWWSGLEDFYPGWLNNQIVRTFPEKVFRLPPRVYVFPQRPISPPFSIIIR